MVADLLKAWGLGLVLSVLPLGFHGGFAVSSDIPRTTRYVHNKQTWAQRISIK